MCQFIDGMCSFNMVVGPAATLERVFPPRAGLLLRMAGRKKAGPINIVGCIVYGLVTQELGGPLAPGVRVGLNDSAC